MSNWIKIIEEEIAVYKATLRPLDPIWSGDVRIIYVHVHARLFEIGLTVGAVKQQCGVPDNNISRDFADHVGNGIKTYILIHRFGLAKRLLRHPELRAVSITQIAFVVGYGSHSAFSTTFKEWVGCSPSEFRQG